jgi:hypothetical protein
VCVVLLFNLRVSLSAQLGAASAMAGSLAGTQTLRLTEQGGAFTSVLSGVCLRPHRGCFLLCVGSYPLWCRQLACIRCARSHLWWRHHAVLFGTLSLSLSLAFSLSLSLYPHPQLSFSLCDSDGHTAVVALLRVVAEEPSAEDTMTINASAAYEVEMPHMLPTLRCACVRVRLYVR